MVPLIWSTTTKKTIIIPKLNTNFLRSAAASLQFIYSNKNYLSTENLFTNCRHPKFVSRTIPRFVHQFSQGKLTEDLLRFHVLFICDLLFINNRLSTCEWRRWDMKFKNTLPHSPSVIIQILSRLKQGSRNTKMIAFGCNTSKIAINT